MTNRSRYFLIASVVALALGLGGGLIAYLSHARATGAFAGLPAELKYVPADAALVAYANVRVVMRSDLRRELMAIDKGSQKGRQMMNDFAGVDLEKEVDHVLGYMARSAPGDTADQKWTPGTHAPNTMMLVQGSFQQARVEQFIRDRGGVVESHNGRAIAVHKGGAHEAAIGFVRPDLIAVGQADMVRRALDSSDRPSSSSGAVPDLTTNSELMTLVRGASGSTAWVVGHFDAVSRGMKITGKLGGQVPPVRYVSATADINGGVKGTIKAETADQAAAEQLRDLVRGFLSLARLHGGAKPEFESVLKSLDLSSTGKTVQLSFAIPHETVRALAPRPSQ